MKVHRRLVYTSKATGKKFYRHELTIPEEALETLGWKAEDEVKWSVRAGRLVIEKA